MNKNNKNIKYPVITALLINLFLSTQLASAQSYPTPEINGEREVEIKFEFETNWIYFRMLKNPLIPDKAKYLNNSRANPYRMLLPEKMYKGNYMPDIKISMWGKSEDYSPDERGYNQYVDFHNCCGFYLVEKKDGFLSIEKKYFSEVAPDSMHINLYDSIFHYDNRFLIKYLYTDKKSFNEYFSFHSGNVEWGEWGETGFMHDIDIVGYIRGVQFGIENVVKFNQDFSDKIKKLRPNFPDYVYTESRSSSLLSSRGVIIAAPHGKEDQLVEFIYYTNKPEKTGDEDLSHFYEMRYILPTYIKSVTERRLEKRLLSEQEKEMIFNPENKIFFPLDPFFIEEPEVIIEIPE